MPTEQGSSSRRSGHPNANAHAERWVGTVRSECLVWTLIRGQGHLELVLRTYVDDYNAHPPTEALDSVLRGGRRRRTATTPTRSRPGHEASDRGTHQRIRVGGVTTDYSCPRGSGTLQVTIQTDEALLVCRFTPLLPPNINRSRPLPAPPPALASAGSALPDETLDISCRHVQELERREVAHAIAPLFMGPVPAALLHFDDGGAQIPRSCIFLICFSMTSRRKSSCR